MIRFRRVVALGLAGLSIAMLHLPAEARVRHHYYRHRLVRAGVPPLPPSQSPIPPRIDGYIAGIFVTGIPGASAADPYDTPGHPDPRLPIPPARYYGE